ncbi:hypothetical protein HYQ45_002424 [Verticillium longisporum]|uniref:Uncharacterized protein n=1 Tax=Verticillium longisporum TaxID=100787 RepID=A0A8I2ZYV7_VERLO|nr:hypothetical protein HYQ44_001088 [Verticillium longisporum]KAG7140707.1 hypothetical protein HYQ45_002424 [Verticillium longisporum]KAG7151617.1 hypothetical protein HYQ46_012597 [Verticillium longisporum]
MSDMHYKPLDHRARPILSRFARLYQTLHGIAALLSFVGVMLAKGHGNNLETHDVKVTESREGEGYGG